MRFIFYLFWLIKEVLVSGFALSKMIWLKTDKEIEKNSGFIKIKTLQTKNSGVLLYANSITLTPGTATVSLNDDQDELTIHAIDLDSIKDQEYGTMDHKILRIF
jgi:multicomponent Na+:H+ antiporter subunit E